MVKDFYIIFFPILINRETIQTVLGKQKMQTPIKTGAIGLALLLGLGLSTRAQTLTPLSPEAVPQTGTFFSAQNRPPMPYDWLPGLPVYEIGQGSYVVDDSSVDYSNLGATGMSQPTGGAMDDSGVPAPPGGWGDGGDGTNSPGGASSSYVLPTNGLFLTITGLTNGILSLAMNGATDFVYEIFSTVSLTNPVWQIEQAVFPATNQNPTPFTVDLQDRTNVLLLCARDWNGILSDGNLTVPEWWMFEYFGSVNVSETSLDSSGTELVTDFLEGVDPNVIYFALNVTNPDFNTSLAPVQMTISGGVPYYMAVLVDNTGFNSANWTPYNSNLVVNLGSVEGWHTVWVGLRGLPPNAQQTWDQIQLKLVLTPPVLIVTNPIPGVVTQPIIQLEGYALLNLASISYDLLNSNTFVTNQQAFVTTRQFDVNNLEYTTNGFACFNIPLANGTNTVTLHATDVAGNVTITNLVYVLDATANTNPPVINLSWPQNNTCISGTNFPVRGIVNDPFATVSAQIANAGGTNGITGLVEQNGSFWIENVPLGGGTNYLTITATNTAGYGSATNFVVIQSPVTLTISSVSFNDPISPTATVTGTLSEGSYIVLVNGVQANNNSNGTWTAQYVPVGDTGTAAISADATANGVPDAMDAQIAMDVVRGSEFALVDCNWNENSQEVGPNFSDILIAPMHWSYGSSGSNLWDECVTDYGSADFTYDLTTWDGTGNGSELDSSTTNCGEIAGTTSTGYMDPAQYFPQPTQYIPITIEEASCNMSWPGYNSQYLDQQRYVLKTRGQDRPGQQNVWVIGVWACYELLGNMVGPPGPIPPSLITVAGQTLDAKGQVYLVLPNNAPPVDITPIAPALAYTFSFNYMECTPLIAANGTNLDTVTTNATFCVGQQINFTLGFSGSTLGTVSYSNELCNWSLPATFVNRPISSGFCTNYTNSSSLLVTTNSPCTCWYVNGSGGTASVGANVIVPTGKSFHIAALGQFAVVAPTIDDFQPPNSLQVIFNTNNGASVSAPVTFNTYVLPPSDFSGTATYAQLVESSDSYYTSVYGLAIHNGESTGGNFWLDNNYPYALDTPQFLSWDDDPVKFVTHNDHPGLEPGQFPFCTSISITNLFKTYLQFQPTGGIPVTIGRIDWGWSCNATESNGMWSWTLTTNQPAPNWSDSTFPLWTNVFHNN